MGMEIEKKEVVSPDTRGAAVIELRRVRGRLFAICALLSLILLASVSLEKPGLLAGLRLFWIGVIAVVGALGVATYVIEFNTALLERLDKAKRLKPHSQAQEAHL